MYSHYRDSQGALLFFDLTDRTTFQHLSFWLEKINDHAEKDTIIMAIGNKYDLVKDNPDDRQITTQEAEDFTRKCSLLYNETSAKTGYNVKEAFENLIESKIYKSVISENAIAIHENQKKGNSRDEEKRKREVGMTLRINNNFGKREGEEATSEEKKQDSCCT